MKQTAEPTNYPAPKRSFLSATSAILAFCFTIFIFYFLPRINIAPEVASEQIKVTTRIDTIAMPPPPPPDKTPPKKKPDTPLKSVKKVTELKEPQQDIKLNPMNVSLQLDLPTANMGNFALPNFSLGEGPNLGVDIFEISEVDKQAREVVEGKPPYPKSLLKRGITGKVVILFIIDQQGNVLDPRIEYSSNRKFNKVSMKAVRKSRFVPAEKNGVVVKQWARKTYDFTINN